MKLKKIIATSCSAILIAFMCIITVRAHPLNDQGGVDVNMKSTIDLTNYTVKATVGKDIYTSDGRNLFKNGNLLVDLGSAQFGIESDNYQGTLLVTDLASDKWNGKTIIYIAGVIFKAYNEYQAPENKTHLLGSPQNIVMSYIDADDYSDVYPYNQLHSKLAAETRMEMAPHYGYRYNTDLFDTADTTDTSIMNYAYSANVVHPHFVLSKFHPHEFYIVHEEIGYKETRNQRHITVGLLNANRDYNSYNGLNGYKVTEYFYMTFDFLNNTGKDASSKFTELNLYDIYVTEQAMDRVVVVDMSKPISMAYVVDISNYYSPQIVDTRWKETN